MYRFVEESVLGEILGFSEIRDVCEEMKEFVVQKNEAILKIKQRCNGVFLVLRGTVIEKVGAIDDLCFQMVYKEGDVVGLQFLLPEHREESISGIYTTPYAVATLLWINCCTPKFDRAIKSPAALEILNRYLKPRMDFLNEKSI